VLITHPKSELEAGFTRGCRQRLDAAMEAKARTIESNSLDTLGFGTLGDRTTDSSSGILVLQALEAFTNGFLDAAAITSAPLGAITCAYRCWLVRWTVRRGTPSLRIWARVGLARRSLAIFFNMSFTLCAPIKPSWLPSY
jgi:hypothetical protein